MLPTSLPEGVTSPYSSDAAARAPSAPPCQTYSSARTRLRSRGVSPREIDKPGGIQHHRHVIKLAADLAQQSYLVGG